MVKKCRVLLNNEEVTVVEYENTKIQFPAVREDIGYVHVEKENGQYFIVDEKVAETKKDVNKKNKAEKVNDDNNSLAE